MVNGLARTNRNEKRTQNVLLKFRLEFPKSDLNIYLPSGIFEIFRQMVGTLHEPISWV